VMVGTAQGAPLPTYDFQDEVKQERSS
jgi:hypothetical protein